MDSNRRGGIVVWPEKTLTIKVNQVGRRIRHPHFCFPCNLREIPAHDSPVREGGYINQPGSRFRKERGKFGMSFPINGAVTGNGLDQQQPVFPGRV